MKRIYPAGPFSWQQRILGHAKELENLGYTITGEWLTQEQQFTRPDNSTVIAPGLHTHCQELSVRDIENMDDADTLIVWEPGIPLERNTRVAEFGAMLMAGKKCIVIGPEDEDKRHIISNIFVHLREIPDDWALSKTLGRIKPVTHYHTWNEFLLDILNPEKVEVCAGCGEEYRVRDCGCPCGSYFIYKTQKT